MPTRTPMIALVGALAPIASAQSLQLVWQDEFLGLNLDQTKWEYMYGDGSQYGIPGWGNNEFQYYTDSPNNIRVFGGNLEITARLESMGGQSYTSARIRTKDLADFLYGRIEASIQLPSATGVWPAFWMLPTGSPYGGWAASGEIDIMESVNQANVVYGTIHYGNEWPGTVFSGGTTDLGGTDFSAGFHEYAIEWEPDEIRWYVDDVLYYSRTSSQWWSGAPAAAGNNRAPFDTPFHLLLNVAVGGNFPGNPNPSEYPQKMLVDYVRVYEFVQAPFGGVPIPIPGTIEAEDFDEGGAGQSYLDCDAVNTGGQYRSTGVDIEVCSEGGFNVGYICTGEWLEYTIDVAQTGLYQIDARVASGDGGGTFRFDIDGTPVSTDFLFPDTGGWQNWTTAIAVANLTAGEHVLRFVTTGEDYNVNRFDFTLVSAPCPADIDGDGDADADDIAAFVTNFTDAIPGNADMDSDGDEDADDIAAFVSAFIAGCP